MGPFEVETSDLKSWWMPCLPIIFLQVQVMKYLHAPEPNQRNKNSPKGLKLLIYVSANMIDRPASLLRGWLGLDYVWSSPRLPGGASVMLMLKAQFPPSEKIYSDIAIESGGESLQSNKGRKGHLAPKRWFSSGIGWKKKRNLLLEGK